MIDNKETKLTAFADDLTTFLQNVTSFCCLSVTLNKFGTCCGLKLNDEKTEALWLGIDRMNVNPPDVCTKKIKPIKILGIFFTYDWHT